MATVTSGDPSDPRPHVLHFRLIPPPAVAAPACSGVWASSRLRAVTLARVGAAAPRLGAISRARVKTARPLELATELNAKHACLLKTALAPSTMACYSSYDSYFFEFCTMHGIIYDAFGKLEADGGVCRAEEGMILQLFAIYVVHYPRDAKMVDAGTLSTGDHAGACVTGLKKSVFDRVGRRPGLPDDESHGLRYTLRSLRKLAPSGTRAPRLPILQLHLNKIRGLLDLKGSQLHRVLWALWTMQWQLVCRCGDLLRRQYVSGPFAARWDTHRVRFQFASLPESSDPHVQYRGTLDMAPNKTNPLGARKQTKTCLVDTTPGAISAGQAVAAMIAGDPLSPGQAPDSVPLFRDPRTGVEITYHASKAALKSFLVAAGHPELAKGCHSLRIGGGTCGVHVAGDFVAGCMGQWTSASKYDYFWYVLLAPFAPCCPRSDLMSVPGRCSRTRSVPRSRWAAAPGGLLDLPMAPRSGAAMRAEALPVRLPSFCPRRAPLTALSRRCPTSPPWCQCC